MYVCVCVCICKSSYVICVRVCVCVCKSSSCYLCLCMSVSVRVQHAIFVCLSLRLYDFDMLFVFVCVFVCIIYLQFSFWTNKLIYMNLRSKLMPLEPTSTVYFLIFYVTNSNIRKCKTGKEIVTGYRSDIILQQYEALVRWHFCWVLETCRFCRSVLQLSVS